MKKEELEEIMLKPLEKLSDREFKLKFLMLKFDMNKLNLSKLTKSELIDLIRLYKNWKGGNNG